MKKPKKANDSTFQFRCKADELAEFRRAAESEGFGSVAAWILWHLRRVIRESERR